MHARTHSFNEPSADRGTISLVHTCTVNGLSDVADEMMVSDIEPSDSNTLLTSFEN